MEALPGAAPLQPVTFSAAPRSHAHLVQQGEANPLRILIICDHHSGQPIVPDVHVAEVLWVENLCQKGSGKVQSLPQHLLPPAWPWQLFHNPRIALESFIQ